MMTTLSLAHAPGGDAPPSSSARRGASPGRGPAVRRRGAEAEGAVR